jgi:hypothetical protein
MAILQQLACQCVTQSLAFSELAHRQANNCVRYIIVTVMKRLVVVILSCFFNGVLYGQTISVPVIVEGDQATLSLRDSDLKVEVNHQPVTVSSLTPVTSQHLLYALINAERKHTLWPSGSAQQIDVAGQFLKEVITAGVDIGSLINFADEYFLDASDTKDPQQLAAKLRNDRSGAALYDAVVATANHLASKADIPGYRRVMFLFCDGEDNLSVLKLNNATERLQREGVPLFIFAPFAVKKKTQGKNLSKLALELGGRVYFLPDDTKTVSFDSVKQDLARSFLLKISIPPSQAMVTLTVADSSQPEVSIIAPSQIGVSARRPNIPPSQPVELSSTVETIVGRIVAYSNGLMCLNGNAEWTVLIRIQDDTLTVPSQFVEVRFSFPCDKLPEWVTHKSSLQSFRLRRDQSADSVLKEFIDCSIESRSSCPRLSVWKPVPTAESEKLPFGQRVPSYRSVDLPLIPVL